MKIILGDFKRWRIKKFVIFLVLMFICITLIYVYDNMFQSQSVSVYTFILLLGLVFMAMIDNAKLLKTENVTYCTVLRDCIHIKNDKFDYKIFNKDIRLVYHKTIRRGGRIKSLDVMGYRLIVECKNKKYVFDSIQKENAIWEETDLIKLYNLFKPMQS